MAREISLIMGASEVARRLAYILSRTSLKVAGAGAALFSGETTAFMAAIYTEDYPAWSTELIEAVLFLSSHGAECHISRLFSL